MNRRQFLAASSLAVGGLLTSRIAPAQEVPTMAFDPFARVALGKTKLKMSRMCLGTGMNGGNRQSNHTRMGKEKFETLLKGAYDRGINTFDLADLYGTHPYVLPALKGVPREKLVLISKLWFLKGGLPEEDRPDANVVIERFLKEIGTDYIDLFLLHCVTDKDWNKQLRKQMDILSEYKSKGVLRALGVSCHSLEALQTAVSEPWVESVHTRINPFGHSMDGPPEKVVPVLKELHAAGKGVIGMKIVGAGKLRNEPAQLDESIRWVLNLGCVDVLNVGCENVKEVDDFAARVKKAPKTA